MSAIRAYVGGEGLWSKSQKESLNSLLRYSSSFEQSDYDESIADLHVPLGDKQARVELEKKKPDVAIARKGFLDGGNSPADIDGMIFLFRNFGSVSYLKQAIGFWTQGDVLLEEQLAIGARMHEVVASSKGGESSSAYAAMKPLVVQLVKNDYALTLLENNFSATLGEASRGVGKMLFYAILILTVFLGGIALTVALFISKIISRVDKAKGEFISLVSHQLRSPLHVVMLSLEMLKKVFSPQNNEQKNAIENIARETLQMRALVETMLDMSRLEAGMLVVNPQMTDIVRSAKKELEALTVIAEKKGLIIREFYEPKEIKTLFDPLLLQMILHNLLSNAVKYTPVNGKISLEITRTSQILIRVSDTGCGIPKEEQGDIFSKLFRATNAHKASVHGTGLGLYMVKSIVDESGGEIWFVSEENIGTTFSVTFPNGGMKKIKGVSH